MFQNQPEIGTYKANKTEKVFLLGKIPFQWYVIKRKVILTIFLGDITSTNLPAYV